MSELESWLRQATRGLASESVARVRSEIREHYESAYESAVQNGSAADEADRLAVVALGDAGTANCQYRNVLLTSAEDRLLRESNWETRALCSRPWLKKTLVAVPVVLLWSSVALFFTGPIDAARILLAAGIALGLMIIGPLMPLYTPRRARIFRTIKNVALAAALLIAFGSDSLKYSWLLVSCAWPMIWSEMTRVSIRRKLPIAQWPKQLYL